MLKPCRNNYALFNDMEIMKTLCTTLKALWLTIGHLRWRRSIASFHVGKIICIRRRSPVERMVARSRRVSRRLSSHGSAATATTGSCTKYTSETKGASSRIPDTDLQHGKPYLHAYR